MAMRFLRIVLLCGIAVSVRSDRDADFCTVPTESCGLIPPPLPTNFIMMSETAVPEAKLLEFHSFYFDNINQKAKFVVVSSGIEEHHIFDYHTQQVITYYSLHPGTRSEEDAESDTCTAQSMSNSKLKHIFGYREGAALTKRSKMFNSNEVLRFGGEYQYAADNTEAFESRGFSANRFVGCIYDAFMDATSNITVYFSNDEMLPAGGTDGYNAANTLFLSIPLAAKYKTIVPDPNVTLPPHTFEAMTNIPWFIGEPKFDYDTFKVPQWIYCKGHTGTQKMAKLPTQFSTRMEVTTFSQNQFGKMTAAEILSYEQIFYDRVKKLARRDYTAFKEMGTEIFEKFNSYGRIKEIYDYNVGVAYIIHVSTGRCYARDIIRSEDYFESKKEAMHDMPASPEELFLIDPKEQVYKGKYFVRDIETEAWSGKIYDESIKLTFYRETYISTDGWHEEADEKNNYSVPVRHTVITDVIGDEGLTQTVREKNFFKFKAGPQPMPVFNTDGCMETIDHTFIVIPINIITTDEEISINDIERVMYDKMQKFLADSSKIGTMLRVQQLELLKSEDQHFILFAFMEKAIATEEGLSVNDAITNLKDRVEKPKGFSLAFEMPGSKEVVQILGSLVIVLSKRESKTEALLDLKPLALPRKRNYAYWREEIIEKVVVKKGMSPGGLAGLSIAMLLIGIVVGIALMYLYIRKYDNPSRSQQFQMKG